MSPARKRPPLEWLVRDVDKEIRTNRLHCSQRIPGMTPDEVRAEMLECVWRAWATYRASFGVPIEKYWWTIWVRHRTDLLAAVFRMKRDISKEILVEPAEYATKAGQHADVNEWETTTPHMKAVRRPVIKVNLVFTMDDVMVPPAPPGSSLLEQAVWGLLATGHTRQDVMSITKITKRRYYEIIHSWRNSEELLGLTEKGA